MPGLDRYRDIAILSINQALFLIVAITVMTLSGLVGRELTPDPALATLPVAAMMLGTVAVTLPASLFMRRVGRKTGFLLGAAFGAAGGGISVAGILAASFWVFCLGNLLLGIFQAFAMYYRFAAADAAEESFRGKAISLVLVGGVAAAFIGPWSASRSVDLLSVTYAGSYAIAGVLALAAMLLLAFLRPSPPPAPDDTGHRPLAVIARQPAFMVALMAAAVGYAVMILVMTATPLAMHHHGHGLHDAAFVMQWHVLGMFAPSFFTGHLIARFGLHRVLLAGTVALGLSVLFAVLGTTVILFWIALTLLGIGWNFLFVGGSTLLTRSHTPAERGVVQGVNDLVIFSLVTAGALLAGTLLHHSGWSGLNLFMLVPVAATAAAVLWLVRLENRRQASR